MSHKGRFSRRLLDAWYAYNITTMEHDDFNELLFEEPENPLNELRERHDDLASYLDAIKDYYHI